MPLESHNQSGTSLFTMAALGNRLAWLSLVFSVIYFVVTGLGSQFPLGENDFDPLGFLILIGGAGSMLACIGTSLLALLLLLPGLSQSNSRGFAGLGITVLLASGTFFTLTMFLF